MRNARSSSRAVIRSLPSNLLLWTAGCVLGIAALLSASSSEASSGLCASGDCGRAEHRAYQRRALDLSHELASADAMSGKRRRRAALSDQEYYSFSGIGAIVCTIDGKQRTSTAFLVGAFDTGVTVARAFTDKGRWARPQDCVYTTTDSAGQIRERIPLAHFDAQWQADPGAFGQLANDFAVIRLAEPSRYAQRTMPLGNFGGSPASVVMIGFKADLASDTMKLKARGTVYGRKDDTAADVTGFPHDIDARGVAAGTPIIDERSGVVIGIHAAGDQDGHPRNAMIVMNDWLETTLKAELKSARAARAEEVEPADRNDSR